MKPATAFLVVVSIWVSNYATLAQTTNLKVGLLDYVSSDDPECDQKANNNMSYPVIILEAYRFGIDKANQDLQKLGINLQPEVLPYCSQDALVFRRIANVTLTQQATMCTPGSKSPNDLIAVVGPIYGAQTPPVASILGEICVPLIASYDTDPAVENLPYFVRTMPNDTYQTMFLAQLLKFMKASPAVLVYDGGNYAFNFVSALRRFAASDANGFNIENEIMLTSGSDSEYEDAMKKLDESKAVAVVVLMGTSGAQNFFKYLQKNAPKLSEKFQFFGPDAIAAEYTAEGVSIPDSFIGVMPYLGENDEFRKSLTSMTLEKACAGNKMELAQVIAQQKMCKDPCGSGSTCDKSATLFLDGDGVGAMFRATFWIESIMQLKEGILSMFKSCNSASDCSETMAQATGQTLIKSLKQLKVNATYGVFTFSEAQHKWQPVASFPVSLSGNMDMSAAFASSPLAKLKDGTL